MKRKIKTTTEKKFIFPQKYKIILKGKKGYNIPAEEKNYQYNSVEVIIEYFPLFFFNINFKLIAK